MLKILKLNYRDWGKYIKAGSEVAIAVLSILFYASETGYAQWSPVKGAISTQWGSEVNPSSVLPEYPRPAMVRSRWKNLNGLWKYSIRPRRDNLPEHFDGEILVPFPVESSLSGVMKRVGSDSVVWYKTSFEIPRSWNGEPVQLNFGAVDWESVVYINGAKVGEHRGGYDSFSFDITGYLNNNEIQELSVSVWDPTNEGMQPRGKQVIKPNGIWYTPVTGIWQTVWIEPVSKTCFESLKLVPDIDAEILKIQPEIKNAGVGDEIEVTVWDGGKEVASAREETTNKTLAIGIKSPKLWSPDSPFLYDLKLRLVRQGEVIDEISSYAGMRKISILPDEKNQPRILLNNKFLFQIGLLDQGWWPDGLYTAPSDEALKYDIGIAKEMGYNVIRKHVKVEPARWYYHCDKMGMLVWQDMPSGDASAEWKSPSGIDGKELVRTPQSAHQYEKELRTMVDQHYNYLCIVMWVPFNEAWGQFNTTAILDWVKQYDPTRLVDGPSGGNNSPAGDVIDRHQYPGPGIPVSAGDGRALVLGEFGGLGLPVEGHTWTDKNWSYKGNISSSELKDSYTKLVNQLPDLIRMGLSAAIYTQTTDVETELNGWLTYDRKVVKIPPEEMKEIHRILFR